MEYIVLDFETHASSAEYVREFLGKTLPEDWTWSLSPFSTPADTRITFYGPINDSVQLVLKTQLEEYVRFRIVKRYTMKTSICRKRKCFTPDTLILTFQGWVPIASVVAGRDSVMTMDGSWQQVLKVYKRKYNGTLNKFFTNVTTQWLKCTPVHNLLVSKYSPEKNQQPIFIAASTVQMGDSFVYPKNADYYINPTTLKSANKYYTSLITKTSQEKYAGDVYDLYVQNNHSYVTYHGIVHNSGGDIESGYTDHSETSDSDMDLESDDDYEDEPDNENKFLINVTFTTDLNNLKIGKVCNSLHVPDDWIVVTKGVDANQTCYIHYSGPTSSLQETLQYLTICFDKLTKRQYVKNVKLLYGLNAADMVLHNMTI